MKLEISKSERRRRAQQCVRSLEERAQLLETGDVARLLNCSPDLVRYFARRGQLPEHRLPSGRRLFQFEDVHRFAVSRGIALEA